MGDEGKEEGEEEGDWGMTLAVGSKGSSGWRSLGKPCISCGEKQRGKESYFLFSLLSYM